MVEMSAFKFYGIGTVACVKELKSKVIQVTPREERFAHQELVHSNPQKQSTTLKSNGGETVVNTTTNNAFPAKWLAYNSMRKTPPDVRHGDEVHLYQLGDDEENMFWVEINSMDEKRLETVIYAISADPKKPMAEDYSNAYFLSFSSHEKRVHLRINKVDGEYTGYTLDINAADGYVALEDDLDNAFFIDSKETRVGYQNADGTMAVADKKDHIMYAPRDIKTTAKERILMKAKKIISDCEDYECTARSSYKINTPDAVFSTKITSPLAELAGIEHTTHKHKEKGDGKPTDVPMA